MRSSPFRLALPFAALVLSLSVARLTAADAPPAATPVAPSNSSAEASTKEGVPTASAVAAPVTPQAPAPAPAPVVEAPPPVADQSTLEAKLAVVLHSYSLLQEENDQLKAAQEKSTAEKTALEAQLGVAKGALPLASQAAALREQLRQTQDQLAAMSLENNELKTRLATGAPAPGTGHLTPVNVPTSLPPVVAPAAPPAPRTYVVQKGDTLGKISRQFYGTVNRWPEILAANRDVLRDEKSLVAGSTLRIP